jgi:hypothetical protein
MLLLLMMNHGVANACATMNRYIPPELYEDLLNHLEIWEPTSRATELDSRRIYPVSKRLWQFKSNFEHQSKKFGVECEWNEKSRRVSCEVASYIAPKPPSFYNLDREDIQSTAANDVPSQIANRVINDVIVQLEDHRDLQKFEPEGLWAGRVHIFEEDMLVFNWSLRNKHVYIKTELVKCGLARCTYAIKSISKVGYSMGCA